MASMEFMQTILRSRGEREQLHPKFRPHRFYDSGIL